VRERKAAGEKGKKKAELNFEGAWKGKSSGRERGKNLSTALRAHGDDELYFEGAWRGKSSGR